LAEERCAAAGITLRVPKPRLCTDNGVMIAALGAHLIAGGAQPSALTVGTDPGLPVEIAQVPA
jgi:N6-L-threonylcarbamoyladenine synthase